MGSERHYSEKALREKLKEIGGTVRDHAVLLYLVLTDQETPAWVRVATVAALGYVIWPFDAVPDLFPLAGYTDDLAVMTGLLMTLEDQITPEMREKARDWYPDD